MTDESSIDLSAARLAPESALKAPLSVEQPSLCKARTLSTNSLGIRLQQSLSEEAGNC